MRRLALRCTLLLPFGIAACSGPATPLVSPTTPSAINSAASEPQPVGSLPPGAANPGAAGATDAAEGTTHPAYTGRPFYIP